MKGSTKLIVALSGAVALYLLFRKKTPTTSAVQLPVLPPVIIPPIVIADTTPATPIVENATTPIVPVVDVLQTVVVPTNTPQPCQPISCNVTQIFDTTSCSCVPKGITYATPDTTPPSDAGTRVTTSTPVKPIKKLNTRQKLQLLHALED
jgi:hypothetical protein